MDKLSLKQLQFGKTDAFNELKELGYEWFVKSFFLYEKYEINSFLKGQSYYICGEKGTGKTAMLRYIQCLLAENPINLIIPIRFKSEFDSEDKKSMLRATSNVKEITAEGLEDFKDDSDAVSVWQVYILNKIFSSIDDFGEYDLFESSRELDEIKKLLKVVYPEYKSKIVPQIKRGNLTINANILKILDAQLQLEIGITNSAGTISFNRIAKTIINKFSKLKHKDNEVYVIFDELELSIHSPKEHQRDIKLVRDLIIAIDRLNEICKLNYYRIHIMASVRTEVIKSVHAAGYEINKSIEDYGVIMSWYQKGGSYEENKLLKLIENKIIASEEINGITAHGDIWEKYFPPKINGISTKRYILNYSWMHPRDIVRLMNQVLRQCDNETKFTQEMFDRALKGYSSASWTEIVEGLCLKYTSQELAVIKQILTNIEVPFDFTTLSEKIKRLCEIDIEYLKFKESHNLREILVDLFEFGVIGNTGQRMIFKFMEDDDLALTEDMMIHKPLRNFFAVKSRKASHKDIYEDESENE
jgi:hypothetical protein